MKWYQHQCPSLMSNTNLIVFTSNSVPLHDTQMFILKPFSWSAANTFDTVIQQAQLHPAK